MYGLCKDKWVVDNGWVVVGSGMDIWMDGHVNRLVGKCVYG